MPSQTTSYLTLNGQAEAISGSKVANTLHNSVIPTLHNYLSYDNSELISQLEVLTDMYETVKAEEEKVYKIFNVSSVEELNDRIKKEMEPLLTFNNTILQQRLQLIDEKIGVGYYLGQFQDVFEKAFNKVKMENALASDEELLAKTRLAIIEMVNNSLSTDTTQFQKTSKNRSLGGLLSNFIIKNGKVALEDVINGTKFRPDVKKRLDDWLKNYKHGQGGEGIKTDYTDTSTTATFLITDKNREAYAGWAYSYSSIKSDPDFVKLLRDKIRDQCCELIGWGNTKCIQAFSRAFGRFPDEALFKNTISGVMGALGEIQLGAIVEMLLDGKDVAQLQTGSLRNELKKTGATSSFGYNGQLSVDFILEGVGFQVKNYNEYANILGLDILKGQRALTLGISGSVSKVNQTLSLNQDLDNIIQLFYGIQSFNEKYQNPDESMLESVDRYDAIEHMIEMVGLETKNLYSLFTDRALRLSQDIQVMTQGSNILKGKYFKTFYFSNGVFIPSSKLLNAVILLFNDLRRGNIKEIVLQSSYSGDVAEDYIDNPETTPTYSSIASQTHLRLNYVFLLDNYLNKSM